LQDQLKQACERQQRLDNERQDERARVENMARDERAYARADAERTAAYDREQRDRQALLDREAACSDRERARERTDLLELADHHAQAAAPALAEENRQLRAAATAPTVQTVADRPLAPAPVTSALPVNTPPAVTVAQLVDTSVPNTPLSTHAGLHSLTGIATSAAAYPARSALQRAADIYDQLPSLSGLPDTCLGTT